MVSIHTDGDRRRQRDEGEEPFAVEADVVRCDDLGRIVAMLRRAPSPASVTEPCERSIERRLVADHTDGRMGEVLLDPLDGTVGEISDIAVVAVQQLVGVRRAHSGVTYAAVMPPSMINDWPVIQLDSLDARNSAPLAISVGSPKRPMGM